jgi:hypothetical protein
VVGVLEVAVTALQTVIMSPNLILKRASASRSSGQWQDEDYDVLADGKVVGRILEEGLALWSAGATVGLVDHRDRAGDAGRDERDRRDARRGEGEFRTKGEGELPRLKLFFENP